MAMPDWRLPTGVPRGAWDYAQSPRVAQEYDAYHAGAPLFDLEAAVVRDALGTPVDQGVVADFGCGSGRTLVPLARDGWRGLAIDLSDEMLAVVRQKAAAEGLAIDGVRANLVELTPDLVPDGAATHGVCLFSTLGMIAGKENRVAALGHMRRVVKPGGVLVLHAHNFWHNLRDPGGPWWAFRSLTRHGRDGYEAGDKTYAYRGVPNFFLHAFRRGELRADLTAAGWAIDRWVPIAAAHRGKLRRPWLLPVLRTQGWFVLARRR